MTSEQYKKAFPAHMETRANAMKLAHELGYSELTALNWANDDTIGGCPNLFHHWAWIMEHVKANGVH